MTDAEQVKGMELVSNCFTIDDVISWVVGGAVQDGFRDRSGETQTVDACDDVAFLFDEEPASIEFLLHPIVGMKQEVFKLLVGDGVEQLTLNAGVLLRCCGMLNLSGIITREITFRRFLLDQFVVDPFGLAVIDRALSFGASAES